MNTFLSFIVVMAAAMVACIAFLIQLIGLRRRADRLLAEYGHKYSDATANLETQIVVAGRHLDYSKFALLFGLCGTLGVTCYYIIIVLQKLL